MAGKNDGKIRCSFCGKTQDQVNRLISGPNGAFICDECIDICAEILEEEGVEGHEDKSSAKDDINLVHSINFLVLKCQHPSKGNAKYY